MELQSLNLLGQITNSFFRVKPIPCNFVHLDAKFQKNNVFRKSLSLCFRNFLNDHSTLQKFPISFRNPSYFFVKLTSLINTLNNLYRYIFFLLQEKNFAT